MNLQPPDPPEDTREIGDVLDDALKENERLRKELAAEKILHNSAQKLLADIGVESEPVGEIVLVDANHFISMEDDTLNELPIGTKLYPAPQPAKVPEGYILAKADADLEMRFAAMAAWDKAMASGARSWPDMMGVIYKAMLSAQEE